jgi:hypothetical protein
MFYSPPQRKRNKVIPIYKPPGINIDTIKNLTQHRDKVFVYGSVQAPFTDLLEDHGAEVNDIDGVHVGDLGKLAPNGTQDFLVEIYN